MLFSLFLNIWGLFYNTGILKLVCGICSIYCRSGSSFSARLCVKSAYS